VDRQDAVDALQSALETPHSVNRRHQFIHGKIDVRDLPLQFGELSAVEADLLLKVQLRFGPESLAGPHVQSRDLDLAPPAAGADELGTLCPRSGPQQAGAGEVDGSAGRSHLQEFSTMHRF